MFFWNSLAFSIIQWMLAIWSLVPLPFLNPAWTSRISQFTYCLENFEHYFASVWDEVNCVVVWIFFGSALLWDWNENWPFPILWPPLSFPNLLGNVITRGKVGICFVLFYFLGNLENYGKLSSGHRTGIGQFSFQSQRRAMPKNAQATTKLLSSHTLVK